MEGKMGKRSTFTVLITLHLCSKITELIKLKIERFTLAHPFGGVSPWSGGPITFMPVARQCSRWVRLVEKHMELLSSC